MRGKGDIDISVSGRRSSVVRGRERGVPLLARAEVQQGAMEWKMSPKANVGESDV